MFFIWVNAKNDIIENYQSDGRGKLSGKLFIKEKVISFWDFPHGQIELRKVANDMNCHYTKDVVVREHNVPSFFLHHKHNVTIHFE